MYINMYIYAHILMYIYVEIDVYMGGVDWDVCMFEKIRSRLLGRKKIFFLIFMKWLHGKGYKESSANHCLGDADVCVYTYTCM